MKEKPDSIDSWLSECLNLHWIANLGKNDLKWSKFSVNWEKLQIRESELFFEIY